MQATVRRKAVLMVCCVLCITALLCGCASKRELDYYSDKQNYVSVSGCVDHLVYNEEGDALYIGLSETPSGFSDTSFKIVGENLKTAQDNGIDTLLTIGDTITFTTAPGYFGDGYVMPIVSLELKGECLLDFESGYKNLLTWLK